MPTPVATRATATAQVAQARRTRVRSLTDIILIACLRSCDLDWVVVPLKRSATVTGTATIWAASDRQARRLATATRRLCRLACTPVVGDRRWIVHRQTLSTRH